MPVDVSDLSESELRKWFGETPDVPDGTFEFALVLGGTVSAGAYTAGAVDFLIEALDCLTEAQGKGSAPPHTVVLKLITGTSGGGVNAAIIARTLAYDYTHDISQHKLKDRTSSGNPFYDVWINALRLDDFLDISDLGSVPRSALNGGPIDSAAQAVARFSGPAKTRSWVPAPLRVFLTLTNLRGIPYRTDLGGGLSQTYIDHADYAKFGLVYPGQEVSELRPDEELLNFDTVTSAHDWERFSQFACATAAFPFGFPPWTLSRPTRHYRYRAVPYPPEPGAQTRIVQNRPDWGAMAEAGVLPEQWEFLSVDGGATDNEPIQLARTALAGLLGRNPRDPARAKRAVWLIDPFAGRADLGPKTATSFLSDAGAILSTFTQQTRYDSADLMMAADPNVFSRFMLTPSHGSKTGSDALASAGLGAFIGFACPEFMRFDYLLGRSNCQRFLRHGFVLGDTNPLFKEWSEDSKRKRREILRSGEGRLPIIPLYGSANVDVKLDDWPRGKLNPKAFRSRIEERYRRIFEAEFSGSSFKLVLGRLGAWTTQQYFADYVEQKITKYLTDVGLD